MNKAKFTFSISKYNEDKNDDFIFNPSDSNTDLFIEKDNPIDIDDNSLNIGQNFNNFEEQIEQKFHQNFLIKEDEKNLSLLSKKRINEPYLEENSELIEEKIKIISEPTKIENKKTKESTGESNKIKVIKKKKLFESNQKIFRNDYYIKKFKVECFSNYVTNKLNYWLKLCDFPKKLHLTKIYMPNNKAFTSNSNLKKNKAFLPIPIKDIFSMQNKEGQNQEKNALNFSRIFNLRNKAGNLQAYDNLVEYLNKTMEEVIKDYYTSDEFKNFITNEEIIEYDKAFYKEKKFSILQDYGFLRLIKGQY